MDLSLIILIALPYVIALALYIKNQNLTKECAAQLLANEKILSQKKSSEVRTGQIAEELAPFLDGFGHDPKKAHFLGQPIDYIIFEDNVITFKEVKSGGAQLNQSQKKIKQLVLDRKVAWEEFRIDGSQKRTRSDENGNTENSSGNETLNEEISRSESIRSSEKDDETGK